MLMPLGDTPNPRGQAWVTWALIVANVAVYVLLTWPLSGVRPALDDPLLHAYLETMTGEGVPLAALLERVTYYDLLVFRYGFRPGDPSLTTLFSSLFLHGGLLHLAGNMLFLWIFGDNVEHRLGRVLYLLGYLGTGVAATLFFALFVPGSQVPLIGASGAISGVLGFYFIWFPRNRVKTFVFLFPFVLNTYLLPSRWVLGFYLLVDNLLPFLLTGGGGGGVAHGAHIGGFLAGAALALGLDRRGSLRGLGPIAAAEGEASREAAEQQPSAAAIEALARDGRLAEAARDYFRLESRAARRPLDGRTLLRLGEHLQQRGHSAHALRLFRRFIAERPADPLLDRAYLGAGRAMLHQPRGVTSAYHYFMAALDLTADPEVAAEARLHLRAIERLGEKT